MSRAARVPRPATRAPRGFTLVELLVALAVGAVTFGAFALVVAQQERSHADLVARVRARGQLREGLAALLVDLRGISTGEGDISPAGARDSATEFRATVGTAIVCEADERTIVGTLESYVTAPEIGDTAWLYADWGDGRAWMALPVAGVGLTQEGLPSSCVGPGAASSLVSQRSTPRNRHVLTLAERLPPAVLHGTPVRVTRRVRYSLYRAPDRRWYLGRREWSATRGRFEGIQPMSGPYRAYATDGTSGLAFEYLDRFGIPVASGADDTRRIAAIAVTLRAPPPREGGRLWTRRDVMAMTLALRNRR